MDEQIPSKLIRPINRPYFLIHTPDHIGNYFQKDVIRIVMARREKLSGFFAPASLNEAGTDARGKITLEVAYDLSAFQQDVTTMDYIPASVVDAFARAAEAFVKPSFKITDYEKRLREGFRLPDPDEEPASYMLYGPPENRQIVILWGTEQRTGTSLPITNVPGYNGSTIIDRLRKRTMGAASMNREALKILERSEHPLARFFASEVRGSDGAVRELISMGRRIPAGTFKKLHHLPKIEIEAFRQAASQYYEQAYAETTGISDYEKQLHAALRVPNLQQHPERYYVTGKKLLIVGDPDEDSRTGVCLTPDSVLGLPPPSTDAQGHRIIEMTATEALAKRATPVKLYAAVAVIAAAAVGVAAAVGIAMLDTEPPSIALNGRDLSIITMRETGPDQHVDTPDTVKIIWNEELDPASIIMNTGEDATNSFSMSDDTGRPVAISSVTVSEDKKSTELHLASPMRDNVTYKIEARHIADTSLRHNVITQLDASFRYTDTVPPTALSTCAEGTDPRKLTIMFDEPLDKASAENPYNYQIDGYNTREAAYSAANNSVTITCEKQNETGLDKGFVNKGRYLLTIQRDVRDASSNHNSHREPYQLKVVYEDTVPPFIQKTTANTQTEVVVLFAEPIKQESVATSDFALLATPSKDAGKDATSEPVEIEKAELGSDKYTVFLTTAPLYNGIKYAIQARALEDMQGNSIPDDKPTQASFFFDGREDSTPPDIMAVRAPDPNHVEVTFSEPVLPGSIIPESFTMYSDMRDGPIPVKDAQVASNNPSKVILGIDMECVEGERVYVVAENVRDRIGNAATSIKSQQCVICRNSMVASDIYAVSCRMLAMDKVELVFNEKLDPVVAGQTRHYYCNGNAMVDDAKCDTDNPKVVVLHLSEPLVLSGSVIVASALVLENDNIIQGPVTFRISQ